MTEPLSKQKAERILIDGISWISAPIEQAVTELQHLAHLKLAALSPADVPPGLHLVYLPARATEPILVTLFIEEALALPQILDLLAEAAAVNVFYSDTGIVLVPIPTVDHEDSDAFDAEEAAGLTIPGLTSTVDAVPAPASTEPTSEPAPPPPPLTHVPSTGTLIESAADEWMARYDQAREIIVARYPAAFESLGTLAWFKFLDLCQAYETVPVDFLALADLIMIYPQRS